jgi:hypothetical protein
LILAVLLLLAVTAPAQARKPTAAARQLEATVRAFLAVLKAGTPAGAVPYLSPRGVVLDMDGERATLVEVRRQFAGKTGLYCRWFDSDCLKREMRDQSGGVFTQRTTQPRSYREILSLAEKPELEVSFDPDTPGVGEASVCLRGPQLAADGAGYLLEFQFERTAAGWKLNLEEGNFAGC